MVFALCATVLAVSRLATIVEFMDTIRKLTPSLAATAVVKL
jgi:hypothetical protein